MSNELLNGSRLEKDPEVHYPDLYEEQERELLGGTAIHAKLTLSNGRDVFITLDCAGLDTGADEAVDAVMSVFHDRWCNGA